MIQPKILEIVDITRDTVTAEQFEELEYVRKVQDVTLFNAVPIDQHDLAYTVFKTAKFVNVLETHNLGDTGIIYKVRVTYPSCEEREHEMAYGDDYDDFND